MSDTVKSWMEERRAIHKDRHVSRNAWAEATRDWATEFPRALDALSKVLELHKPGEVFTWAEDCADPENHHLFTDVRTGDMLCEDEPLGRFCDGCVPENDTTIDADEYPWPCATVRALGSALLGADDESDDHV